jgi:hypothetical protein
MMLMPHLGRTTRTACLALVRAQGAEEYMTRHLLSEEEELNDADLEEVLKQLHPVIADYIRESREDEDTPTIIGDEPDDDPTSSSDWHEAPEPIQHRSVIAIRWISHLVPLAIALAALLAILSMVGK